MEGAKIIEIDEEQLCKLCNNQLHKYVCPRCGIKYCSVDCYKSEVHLECSESFYKQCVEEELKLDEKDPETRRRMLEILKKAHEDQEDDLDEIERLAEEGLDSDDDEGVPDLAERLQNIDLDDADSLWAALTDAEKQEFEAMLNNGEVEKLLPQWKPWWSYRRETKLVEDLSESSEKFDYKKECPEIVQVPEFKQISKAEPSPFVRNNVLNVLHAYTFMVLHFNGDHHSSVREATSLLMQLCNNLRENQIFQELELAVESVSQLAINFQCAHAETLSAMKSACASILRGPEDSSKFFYVSAALSDVHRLLSEAKKLKDTTTPERSNKEFSKRFSDKSAITRMDLPKDKLRLCVKKIEYYLSWVTSYGDVLCV